MFRFSKSPVTDFTLSFVMFIVMAVSGFLILNMNVRDVGPKTRSAVHVDDFIKAKPKTVTQLEDKSRSPVVTQAPKLAPQNKKMPRDSSNEGDEYSIHQLIAMVDQGKWQDAERNLLKFIEKNPNNEDALVELAMIQLIDKKDAHAAKPYLEKAITINPENESVISELISIYEETDSMVEGLAFMKGLLKDEVGTGVLNFGIGTSLLNQGRAEEAVEYLHKAQDLGGVQHALVQEDLADAYLDSGRVEEAIQLFSDLIEQGGSKEQLKSLTIKSAYAYLDRGDRDLAIEVLQDWIKQNPRDDFTQKILNDIQNF